MAASTLSSPPAGEVVKGCPDGVLGQHGTVDLHGRKPAQRLYNVLLADAGNLFKGGASDHFGQNRTGGNGSGTSEAFERGAPGASVGNGQIQMEDVTAGGIFRNTDRVGVVNNSGIARVPVMVEDGIAVTGQRTYNLVTSC